MLAARWSAAAALSLGYVAAGYATSLWLFALAYVLIGFGTSATFGPMMADLSQWFTRRRGIAVAIASSGNYLAGTIWPPVIEHFIARRRLARDPHRHRHLLRRSRCCRCCWRCGAATPAHHAGAARPRSRRKARSASRPMRCRRCLCVAGLACCVAMAMPQVHIVAYCGDLGYGPARGAEMLSLMLGFGIVSRLATGFIADRARRASRRC